jgi:hypothetical protein
MIRHSSYENKDRGAPLLYVITFAIVALTVADLFCG